MKTYAQILSLKKIQIIKHVKKRRYKVLTPLCSVVIVCLITLFTLGGTRLSNICNSMCYIYNPVNSLYSDNSNIIFTGVNVLTKESLDFVIPITSGESSVDEFGNVMIVVKNSIMVKSIESGVVEDVGVTLDGVKYIKILHAIDTHSLLENLSFVGVKKGDIIKKGQDIATAKEGDRVTLKLYDGEMQIKNLKVHQSKIICEK
jgi:hypothetical protein